jgi:hypothetical protein
VVARVGLILMMLVCHAADGVSLAMGYTEGLFLALVAGTLLAAHQRVWWAAGLLGSRRRSPDPRRGGRACARRLGVLALVHLPRRTSNRLDAASGAASIDERRHFAIPRLHVAIPQSGRSPTSGQFGGASIPLAASSRARTFRRR